MNKQVHLNFPISFKNTEFNITFQNLLNAICREAQYEINSLLQKALIDISEIQYTPGPHLI